MQCNCLQFVFPTFSFCNCHIIRLCSRLLCVITMLCFWLQKAGEDKSVDKLDLLTEFNQHKIAVACLERDNVAMESMIKQLEVTLLSTYCLQRPMEVECTGSGSASRCSYRRLSFALFLLAIIWLALLMSAIALAIKAFHFRCKETCSPDTYNMLLVFCYPLSHINLI